MAKSVCFTEQRAHSFTSVRKRNGAVASAITASSRSTTSNRIPTSQPNHALQAFYPRPHAIDASLGEGNTTITYPYSALSVQPFTFISLSILYQHSPCSEQSEATIETRSADGAFPCIMLSITIIPPLTFRLLKAYIILCYSNARKQQARQTGQ